MQLHQLRYFVAVAETRHFTHAADNVGITQPSLSKQIHVLEADLGAPLFVAAGLGVALVPGIVVAGRPGIRVTSLAPPGVARTIALARRREGEPTHAARALRRILLEYLRTAAEWEELPAGVRPVFDPAG